MKQLACFLTAGAMLLTLCACSGSPASSPSPDPTPTVEPTPTPPLYTNPLTGEATDTDLSGQKPVTVVMNNIKVAMPQQGNSTADIIYEAIAEGGITRMVGVYQTLEGVETLGSIRSTRAYYLELALGHDALLVHAGGSPEAYADIPAWGVDNMDGVNGGSDAKIFWRDTERRKTAGYEHSLLTSGQNILDYLAKGRFRTEHRDGYTYTQAFAEDGTPAGGMAAEHVTLKFSSYKTGTFDYDAASGKYMVGQYGTEYVDGNTGEQVGVTNVMVLETAVSVISGDTAGRLTVKLTGSGKGTYFCGGRAVPIQWSKADRNSQFVYKLEDGTPLTLGQGTSYVCVMSPKTSTLTYQ